MARMALKIKEEVEVPKLKVIDETQSSVQKQHEITWNRSLLGSNLAPNGPWQKTQLPLLKTKSKFREFFVRVDSHSIVHYFLDENKNRTSTTLFYPSETWIREFEARKDKTAKTVYEKLYMKLKENGLGQTVLSSGKIPLKPTKKKPKRVQLKKTVVKKLKLKRG